METLFNCIFQAPYFSPVTKTQTFTKKTFRLSTFPDFLVITLKKYDVGPDWRPFKLDAEVLMPEKINLERLRGHGKLPSEEELPEEPAQNVRLLVLTLKISKDVTH